MAKLGKDEYWAILNQQGNFMSDSVNRPVIRKTRGELLEYAGYLYHDEEIKQMIFNGQTDGAFPRVSKIKITYQVI